MAKDNASSLQWAQVASKLDQFLSGRTPVQTILSKDATSADSPSKSTRLDWGGGGQALPIPQTTSQLSGPNKTSLPQLLPAGSASGKRTTSLDFDFSSPDKGGSDELPLPGMKGGKGGKGTGKGNAALAGLEALSSFKAGGSKLSSGGDQSFGGMGDMVKGAGSALQMIPHPAAQAAGMLIKFAGSVIESVDKIKQWTSQLHEANMKFAEFSGSMSAVKFRQEMFEIQQSRTRGDRRAASAEYLNEGRRKLETQTNQVDDSFARISNIIGGKIAGAVGDILEASQIGSKMEALAKWVESMVGVTEAQLLAQTEFGTYLSGKRGAWIQNHSKPRRHQRRADD